MMSHESVWSSARSTNSDLMRRKSLNFLSFTTFWYSSGESWCRTLRASLDAEENLFGADAKDGVGGTSKSEADPRCKDNLGFECEGVEGAAVKCLCCWCWCWCGCG